MKHPIAVNNLQLILKVIITSLIPLSLLCIDANAQTPVTETIIKTEEINIVKPYKPTLSDAYKISTTPEMELLPETTQTNLSYDILSKEYKTSYEPGILKPATMKTEPINKLYRAYMKAGFGMFTTPVAEIYYNNLRSRSYSAGGYIKHYSSKGQIANSDFSDNEVGIYGKKFFNAMTLSANADYSINKVNTYGIPPDNKYVSINEQTFNYFAVQTTLSDNLGQKALLNYDLGIKYYHLFEGFFRKEDDIFFHAKLKKQLKTDTLVTLDINGDFSNYEYNINDESSNYLISLIPRHSIVKGKWSFNLGVNMTNLQDSIDSFHFYPDLNLSCNIVEKLVTAYAGISGNSQKNSLKSLTDLNPFLKRNINILHTNNKYIMFAGARGIMSSSATFDFQLTYKDVEQLAFFVNDTMTSNLATNEFNIVYDNAGIVNAHAEIGFQQSERLKLLMTGDYNYYELNNELKPWHTPTLKVNFWARYNIGNKIIVTGECYAVNNVYAREYTPSLTAKELKGFTDISLSGEYRFSKSFAVFLNLNNILNKKYYLWNNYQTHGFNILGGLTYSF